MMTEEQKQALIERLNKLAEGLKWHNVAYAQDVLSALAALTQPASPAFQLPDEMVIDGRHLNDDSIHNVFKRGEKSGFNRCLREVLKLNAPHTAQIEPICATGGAEWVNVRDQLPPDRETVMLWDADLCEFDKGHYSHKMGLFYRLGEVLENDITHWKHQPAAPTGSTT